MTILKLNLPDSRCSKETEAQKAASSFSRIIATLEGMNKDMINLSKSVDDLTVAHMEHEQDTFRKNELTQDRINFMNYRILEIRQLTGCGKVEGGMSKRHLKKIKEMKRGSVFETIGDDDLDEDGEDEDAEYTAMIAEAVGMNLKNKFDSLKMLRQSKDNSQSEKSIKIQKSLLNEKSLKSPQPIKSPPKRRSRSPTKKQTKDGTKSTRRSSATLEDKVISTKDQLNGKNTNNFRQNFRYICVLVGKTLT